MTRDLLKLTKIGPNLEIDIDPGMPMHMFTMKNDTYNKVQTMQINTVNIFFSHLCQLSPLS